MSHVVKLKVQIKNLGALEKAAAELGCELVRGQQEHLYYAGNRAKCDHAIKVTGASEQTYEIGVIAKNDGTYELQADFYNGGYGLVDRVGSQAETLINEYAVQLAMQHVAEQGYRPYRWVNDLNQVVVTAER